MEENQKSSKWLAVFMLLGGLYICPFMLGYAGWYANDGYREFMFFMPFQQLFLMGPVFFFYIKTLLDSTFQFQRKDLIHFLPAFLYLMYSLIVFVVDQFILDQFYFYADERDKDLDFWYQMAGLISMLAYLVLSFRHYQNYRKISVQELSFADEIAFKWVQNFALAFGLILILRVLFFILNPEWGQFGSKYWYYLCFSCLLLYVSITGYTHTVQSSLSVKNPFKVQPLVQEIQPKSEAPISFDQKKWKAHIIRLFEEEHMYKNPKLTLSEVADQLQTNRNIISQTINQEFDMNFNDFVNEKRTEAVISLLQKGEHTTQTLLGIAMDCGFNSKTTFNRAFKKYTNLTPMQYILKNGL